MIGDFIKRETDADFFLPYVKGKADDALNALMSNNYKIP